MTNPIFEKSLKYQEAIKKFGVCGIRWPGRKHTDISCDEHRCKKPKGHSRKCICHCGTQLKVPANALPPGRPQDY